VLLFAVAWNVGRARGKYKVKAPATTGDPAFERAFRVQMNTLESAVAFLPVLWLFAAFVERAVVGRAGRGVARCAGVVCDRVSAGRGQARPGFRAGVSRVRSAWVRRGVGRGQGISVMFNSRERAMNSIEIVDRASLTQGLYRELKLDPRQTAVVAIDMHRGHLDMEVATMPAQPEDARRVIANARAALDFAREAGVPVIHVILVYRRIPGLGSEGMVSPFWRALHAAMAKRTG